jgi:hypothetical protein
MTGFRSNERRIRRRLKRAQATNYLSDFEVYFVERHLFQACYLRSRVLKMHDATYRRAIETLAVAESVLWLKGSYLREKRCHAAKGKETLPGADVPRQDAG